MTYITKEPHYLPAAIVLGCINKNRYDTEKEVRAVGRARSNVICAPLYVYPCRHCSGWHLTRKERTAYWNANALTDAASDDFSDLLGDPQFWARLVDMPHEDAEITLRVARRTANEIIVKRQTDDEVRMILLQGRLKDELIFLSNLRYEANWKNAALNLFGQDGLQAMIAEVSRLWNELTVNASQDESL